MATLNISLPQGMKDFVEQQVHKDDDYSSVSDYVRALIREDQKREAEDKLEALLLEGLDSGDSKEMTQKDWDDIRQALRKKAAQQKTA
jgi:antitoxin ParD1/3/4